MRTSLKLVAAGTLAVVLAHAQAGTQGVGGGQRPAAAAILDRYIEMTGGSTAYRKINASVLEITTTGPDRSNLQTTVFQSRDGREQEETELNGHVQSKGVANGGVAWEYSESSGVRILSGKDAEHRVAAARAFLDDDWRKNFPTAMLISDETVEGTLCAHVRLVRTDGAIRDSFYNKKTGLLMRNVMRDEEGDKNPTVLTVANYEESDGLKYPASFRVERDGVILQTKIESARFAAKPPPDAFRLPEQAFRAILRAKSTNGMPNAIELVERYITETGGKDAYKTLRSEKISGEISVAAAGIKGKISLYEAAGGKLYTSVDLPGAGKFESGSDGKLSWEQSALLGPRLVPRSRGSRGMLGPGPDQVMTLLRAFENVETVGKEQANGAPCWSIRISGPDPNEQGSTMCFDVGSGYLTRMTGITKTQMGTMPFDLTMSNYQDDGGIKSPHHLETRVSGQPLNIDITEVVINASIPNGTFELPPEIKALAAKKTTSLEKQEGLASERPSLRRSR